MILIRTKFYAKNIELENNSTPFTPNTSTIRFGPRKILVTLIHSDEKSTVGQFRFPSLSLLVIGAILKRNYSNKQFNIFDTRVHDASSAAKPCYAFSIVVNFSPLHLYISYFILARFYFPRFSVRLLCQNLIKFINPRYANIT